MYEVPMLLPRPWYEHPAVQVFLGLLVTVAAGVLAPRFSTGYDTVGQILYGLGWAGDPPVGLFPKGVWVGLVVGLSQVLLLIPRPPRWVSIPWVLATMVASSMAYYTFWNPITAEARMGFLDPPPTVAWDLGLKASLVPGIPLWIMLGLLLLGMRQFTIRRPVGTIPVRETMRLLAMRPSLMRWRVLGMLIGWLLLWLMLATLFHIHAWESGGGLPPEVELP